MRILSLKHNLLFLKKLQSEVSDIVKRLFDFIVSFLAIIIFIIPMIIISLLIKIDDGGPVLFKQKRGGYKQRHFNILKFRTMVLNAEKKGLGYKTEENDPRITKIGKFLRKYSLDEIPQLFNVLKGDMSIVGPRPALTVQTDEYNEYQKRRLDVKPGITGLAQVNGRNALTWDERIEWDIEYVESQTFLYDIKIIFKTVSTVFGNKNIYNG